MKQHKKIFERLLLTCAAKRFLSVPSVTYEAAWMTNNLYVTISAGRTQFMIDNSTVLPYTDIYTTTSKLEKCL